MSLPTVDPPEFRQLLGRFATGVVIITVIAPDGRPHGMTANSLVSVSLGPPLVSVCIDHRAELHAVVTVAERFVVNILAADQEALSRRFADPHDDRFDGVGYTLSERGSLVLDGTLAHIECARCALHEAGDHTIVVGQVLGGGTGAGRPLLYYRGGYAALA
ncbi:MAG TPA: flavin reductase family protein [Gemmatimonadales bacterium]|nr:flavin reductase family protein [Gemmatimonadales bacterium]